MFYNIHNTEVHIQKKIKKKMKQKEKKEVHIYTYKYIQFQFFSLFFFKLIGWYGEKSKC